MQANSGDAGLVIEEAENLTDPVVGMLEIHYWPIVQTCSNYLTDWVHTEGHVLVHDQVWIMEQLISTFKQSLTGITTDVIEKEITIRRHSNTIDGVPLSITYTKQENGKWFVRVVEPLRLDVLQNFAHADGVLGGIQSKGTGWVPIAVVIPAHGDDDSNCLQTLVWPNAKLRWDSIHKQVRTTDNQGELVQYAAGAMINTGTFIHALPTYDVTSVNRLFLRLNVVSPPGTSQEKQVARIMVEGVVHTSLRPCSRSWNFQT